MIPLAKYIAEHGKGCGIGPAIAQRIVNEMGSDCLQVIRDTPELLCDLFRTIKPEQAEEFAVKLRSNHCAEQTYIELQSLFDKRGFPKKIVKQIIGEHGAESLKVVRRNPFALLKYDGVGFKLCDRLFRDLNQGRRPERRLRRIAHLICSCSKIAAVQPGMMRSRFYRRQLQDPQPVWNASRKRCGSDFAPAYSRRNALMVILSARREDNYSSRLHGTPLMRQRLLIATVS